MLSASSAAGSKPYAAELEEFDAFSKKLDALFVPTAEMRATDKEYADLCKRTTARKERLLHAYDATVRKPIYDNITRQLAHTGGSIVHPTLSVTKATGGPSLAVLPSAAAAAATGGAGGGGASEEALLRSTGRGGTVYVGGTVSNAKLRGTLSADLWHSAAERIELYTRPPQASGKELVSTLPHGTADHFTDHSAYHPASGRDLTVDAEFPRGKRTYVHPPTFTPA